MAMTANYALHTLLIIGFILILTCTTGTAIKRICGKELADTLQSLCKNNYNGFVEEHSGTAQIRHQSALEYQSIPFISKLTGGVLSTRVRRKRHGVADECCKKACSYRELRNYCNG